MENVIATKAENAFDNEHLSNSNSVQQTSLCVCSFRSYHILQTHYRFNVQTNEQIMSNKCLALFAIGNLKRSAQRRESERLDLNTASEIPFNGCQ